MNKLKIPKGTVITCPTEKDAEELMKVFDKLGLKWASGDSYIKSNYYWDDFKENTIYDVFSGTYGNIEWSNYPNKITAQEFIKLHTMEKRNVTLTLDKAKEFYNRGNTALKEIALQSFTEEELTEKPWQKIKTFWEAVDALGLSSVKVLDDLSELKKMANRKHVVALYKLDIIHKALNGKEFDLDKDYLYCPNINYTLFKPKDTYHTNDIKFIYKNETYVINERSYVGIYSGVGDYDKFNDTGHINIRLGMLACKSVEIAKHFSEYFAKEIFEASYAGLIDFQWC